MTGKKRPLLTVPDVAEQLSLSRRMVYQMIANKTFPAIKIGRAVRISPDAFDHWMEDKEGEEQESRNQYGTKARHP